MLGHADAVDEDRGRSAERLVTFTDAVVAIAITLLALPLTEIGRHVRDHGLGAYFEDKGPTLLGFLISFLVIARLWWAHHRIFAHVVRWDGPLVHLTVFWLFTIVSLAPATALNTSNAADGHPDVVALYIGVMAVSSALLTGLAWHIRRHPDLTDGHDTAARARLSGSVAATVGFVLALVVGTAIPAVNYFAILLLFITGRIGALIDRRLSIR
jgi:uncharacterized membrane protein